MSKTSYILKNIISLDKLKQDTLFIGEVSIDFVREVNKKYQ